MQPELRNVQGPPGPHLLPGARGVLFSKKRRLGGVPGRLARVAPGCPSLLLFKRSSTAAGNCADVTEGTLGYDYESC